MLHRYPYRETSVIVDLFTAQHGRFSVIAKGVRSARSRLKPILHPFIALQITAQGKSNLKTLTSAEPVGKPYQLHQDALMSALYINELLTRLLHKDESHDELFHHYQQTLLALSNGEALQPVLRLFEGHLLTALGYAISFYYTADDHKKIEEDCCYCFIVEHGFVKIIEKIVKNEINFFKGKEILAIAQNDFSKKENCTAAKRLYRLAFQPLLGNKTLKSKEILQSLHAN